AGQRDVRRLECPCAGAENDVARRVVADQEQGAGGDLLRCEGMESGVGEEPLGHPRARGGRDAVDADVVLGAFEVERLGEPGNA
nr:hypothetical protein [Tanacetum cinerariifolium]